jgi:hypothetical protein
MTLELFATKATLTPKEIDDHVKNGPYAAKHIWFLRKHGHDISVNKDGRSVVSYTYNGTVDLSMIKAKAPAKAKTKAKAPAPVKEKDAPAPAAKKSKKVVMKKPKKVVDDAVAVKRPKKVVDDAEAAFGTTGAVSHAVDPDWDKVDVSDLAREYASLR